MIIQSEKTFNDGKKLLVARYAGSYKELRTIIGFANAISYPTPQALCQQFGLYFKRFGWSGDGDRYQKQGMVVDLLFGLVPVVKAVSPAPEVRIFIAPAASHAEPRPVQGKDFAEVKPVDKVPTLVIGVAAGSGPNLPEVIQLLTCLKPPLARPFDLNIVVLYDGADQGNNEPTIKAKIDAEKKKNPDYKPPNRANGTDMATVARATTRYAYDVTEAKGSIDLMMADRIQPGTVDYIVILDHGVKFADQYGYGETTQQWGSDKKVFAPTDAKLLAPYLKPFGVFVLAGCHAGQDRDAVKAIAVASHRAVYANPTTETSIMYGQSLVLTSSKFKNNWKCTQP